jgi:protein-L-isoaspartate O-methyltransferase
MVQGLRLAGGERVLEVGTGFGFQTAILALLARQVVSVERFGDLAERARANLEAVGLGHVRVVVGDGTLGVPEHASYQAIVVAAAAPRAPAPLGEQLTPGGRLVHPPGPDGRKLLAAFRKEGDRLVGDAQLTRACFVPSWAHTARLSGSRAKSSAHSSSGAWMLDGPNSAKNQSAAVMRWTQPAAGVEGHDRFPPKNLRTELSYILRARGGPTASALLISSKRAGRSGLDPLADRPAQTGRVCCPHERLDQPDLPAAQAARAAGRDPTAAHPGCPGRPVRDHPLGRGCGRAWPTRS